MFKEKIKEYFLLSNDRIQKRLEDYKDREVHKRILNDNDMDYRYNQKLILCYAYHLGRTDFVNDNREDKEKLERAIELFMDCVLYDGEGLRDFGDLIRWSKESKFWVDLNCSEETIASSDFILDDFKGMRYTSQDTWNYLEHFGLEPDPIARIEGVGEFGFDGEGNVYMFNGCLIEDSAYHDVYLLIEDTWDILEYVERWYCAKEGEVANV